MVTSSNTSKRREKEFWYKFFTPCFGEWDCLTGRGTGAKDYSKCKIKTACRNKMYRDKQTMSEEEWFEKRRRLLAEKDRQ